MFNPFSCIMKSFDHYSFDFLEGAFFAGAFFAGCFRFLLCFSFCCWGFSCSFSFCRLQRLLSSSAASACLRLLRSTVLGVQGVESTSSIRHISALSPSRVLT